MENHTQEGFHSFLDLICILTCLESWSWALIDGDQAKNELNEYQLSHFRATCAFCCSGEYFSLQYRQSPGGLVVQRNVIFKKLYNKIDYLCRFHVCERISLFEAMWRSKKLTEVRDSRFWYPMIDFRRSIHHSVANSHRIRDKLTFQRLGKLQIRI